MSDAVDTLIRSRRLFQEAAALERQAAVKRREAAELRDRAFASAPGNLGAMIKEATRRTSPAPEPKGETHE